MQSLGTKLAESLPHVYTLSPPQTPFAGIVDNDDKAITNLGGIETIMKVSLSMCQVINDLLLGD